MRCIQDEITTKDEDQKKKRTLDPASVNLSPEKNDEMNEQSTNSILTIAGFVSLPVMLLSELTLFRTGLMLLLASCD